MRFFPPRVVNARRWTPDWTFLLQPSRRICDAYNRPGPSGSRRGEEKAGMSWNWNQHSSAPRRAFLRGNGAARRLMARIVSFIAASDGWGWGSRINAERCVKGQCRAAGKPLNSCGKNFSLFLSLSLSFSPSFSLLCCLPFFRLFILFALFFSPSSLSFIYRRLKNTAWRNYPRYTNWYIGTRTAGTQRVWVTLHASLEDFRVARENVTNLFPFAFCLQFLTFAKHSLWD